MVFIVSLLILKSTCKILNLKLEGKMEITCQHQPINTFD